MSRARDIGPALAVAAVNLVWIGFVSAIVWGGLLLALSAMGGATFPWQVFGQMVLVSALFGAFAGFMEDMWPGTIRRGR